MHLIVELFDVGGGKLSGLGEGTDIVGDWVAVEWALRKCCSVRLCQIKVSRE